MVITEMLFDILTCMFIVDEVFCVCSVAILQYLSNLMLKEVMWRNEYKILDFVAEQRLKHL